MLGFDQVSAEVFVNLATGATLPIRARSACSAGRLRPSTTAPTGSPRSIGFGIVSDRAVLLDRFTVIQNLAMPFTLEIEPPPDDVRIRAESLAREVGLPEPAWGRAIAELNAASLARVRLGRALALDPEVLLLEHISATLDRDDVQRFGAEVRAIATSRGIALVVATADEVFARAVATRVLTLEPSTGRLNEARSRRCFEAVSARMWNAKGDRI